MEMHEITKKLESSGKKGKKEPIGSANHTFKPAVNAVVPDFDKAKEDWDRTLQVGHVTFDPNSSVSKDPPSHPIPGVSHCMPLVTLTPYITMYSSLYCSVCQRAASACCHKGESILIRCGGQESGVRSETRRAEASGRSFVRTSEPFAPRGRRRGHGGVAGRAESLQQIGSESRSERG